MWDFLNSDIFGTLVVGVLTLIGNKIWTRSSDKTQQKITAAIGEARSVIQHLVETAAPDATPEQIIIWSKGAAAIQLAKVGLDPENKLIKALVNELVAGAVLTFVRQNGVRAQNMTPPPILAKLPK